ncbi:hypothetical protein [Polymorphospora lycopeni]|uniref:Uncharacterized protein n=1 Tax=Polymorphospora lycopeni TaxID=3140240 RepID=A0ABV5CKY3_9ACTN
MPDAGWTPIANTAHRDYGLSWRARGLLGELLSYPDGWDTNVDKLVEAGRRYGNFTEGRAAMRTAMKELADRGYVQYVREADAKGKWTTVVVVSDVRITAGRADVPETGTSDIRDVGEPGRRETGTSEDRSVTTKTDTNTETKTDLQRSGDEHSESLASLALASDEASSDDENDEASRVLNNVYRVIDNMDPDLRRRHLLAVERKRPKIYRECRKAAIEQLERADPEVLKGSRSAMAIDRLSYKWMAQHYSPRWPQWFSQPLEVAWREMGMPRAA